MFQQTNAAALIFQNKLLAGQKNELIDKVETLQQFVVYLHEAHTSLIKAISSKTPINIDALQKDLCELDEMVQEVLPSREESIGPSAPATTPASTGPNTPR